ncbi:MAG: very short patch repair endonuclease [Nitrospira sp.]|nr:very short patch repair endonuclease [Nitrospira sp.]
MADVFSKNKRSKIMAAVRSSGNKKTEKFIERLFRRNGIVGWRRQLSLPGKPDFAFRQGRLALFVDGCFWHGCSKHCRIPVSNHNYWLQKIARNCARDKDVARQLRGGGWRVLRFWEHDLSNESRLLTRLARVLAKYDPSPGRQPRKSNANAGK